MVKLAQMVMASAETTSCKPLSRRYEFDSSQGQFVCSDMFVNGLAVTFRPGWFHSASCLSRGRTHVLAFLHLNSPRHCCIYGKRALGRMMQQWRVVGIRIRGGKTSMMGLQCICWGLRLVVGSVVLSLRPGGGDTLTRGLNEVRQKINGGALRHT